ncbi:MAG: hypothetical protein ACM3X1_06485 [Ignavibacteriales bacterium]
MSAALLSREYRFFTNDIASDIIRFKYYGLPIKGGKVVSDTQIYWKSKILGKIVGVAFI